MEVAGWRLRLWRLCSGQGDGEKEEEGIWSWRQEKGKQQERAEAGHEEGGRKLSRRPRVEKREQLGIPGGLRLDLG